MIGTSGKLYLAVVLDLFSRFAVGWVVSAVNDRFLPLKALDMARKRRCPAIGLRHHSDQGCTYASDDYHDALDAHGIVCSMSRRGHCHDNAVMESFFSTVKSELADQFAVTATRRWRCSMTSKCSITSGAGIRRLVVSARRPSNGTQRRFRWRN